MVARRPEAVKTRALELYLQDKTVPAIAETLRSEFQIKLGAPAIYAWATKGKWSEKRAGAQSKALTAVLEDHSLHVSLVTQEQLDAYGKVRKMGGAYLDAHPEFDKTIDAVKAVDIGIQGERKIMAGLVGVEFIRDVLQVIVEEITDEQLLQKISARLRRLAVEVASD